MTAWTDRSEQIDALAAAWAKAAGEMHDIAKTQQANAGQYGYSYATLADAFAMARPVLARHGLVVTQTAATIGDEVAISTTVLHSSGQFVTAQPLTLPAGKTAQQTGSAITYGRRYALMAMLGLATEDDDGASAAPRSADRPREAARTSSSARNTSQATSTPRSPAEGEIRTLLAQVPRSTAEMIRDEFVKEFGASLKDLPVPDHERALTWVVEMIDAATPASE